MVTGIVFGGLVSEEQNLPLLAEVESVAQGRHVGSSLTAQSVSPF